MVAEVSRAVARQAPLGADLKDWPAARRRRIRPRRSHSATALNFMDAPDFNMLAQQSRPISLTDDSLVPSGAQHHFLRTVGSPGAPRGPSTRASTCCRGYHFHRAASPPLATRAELRECHEPNAGPARGGSAHAPARTRCWRNYFPPAETAGGPSAPQLLGHRRQCAVLPRRVAAHPRAGWPVTHWMGLTIHAGSGCSMSRCTRFVIAGLLLARPKEPRAAG